MSALPRPRRTALRRALPVILATAAFTLAWSEAAGTVGPALNVAATVALFCGIWWLLHPARRRAGAILLASNVAGGLLSTGVVVPAQAGCSMARGDRLGRALEGYRSEHGEYPSRLAALVPQYVDELPPTCMGVLVTAEFHYQRTQQGFRISFAEPLFMLRVREHDMPWRRID